MLLNIYYCNDKRTQLIMLIVCKSNDLDKSLLKIYRKYL